MNDKEDIRLKNQVKNLKKKLLKAKNELKISEEKYKKLLERSSDIIFVHQNYKIVLASKACAKLLGAKEPKDLIGKHLLKDIVHPDYINIVKKRVMQIVKDGREVGFLEEKIKKLNGEIIDIDVCAVPFLYKGKPAVKVYARDITHIKKLQKEIKERSENLQNLTNYIQRIIEDEKLKISQELHDDLGQLLTILKLDIIEISKTIPADHNDILEKINTMENLLDLIINRLRIISYQLRPPILDHLGLESAIKWQLEEFERITKIKCIRKIKINNYGLTEKISINVFRILQEILTNIIRHSKAKEVIVYINQNNKKLILKVKDNGIGIDVEKINYSKSLGILNMKERVLSLNGKFKLLSDKGKGTIIEVCIPLEENKNGNKNFDSR